jgi:hypothetical protein
MKLIDNYNITFVGGACGALYSLLITSIINKHISADIFAIVFPIIYGASIYAGLKIFRSIRSKRRLTWRYFLTSFVVISSLIILGQLGVNYILAIFNMAKNIGIIIKLISLVVFTVGSKKYLLG